MSKQDLLNDIKEHTSEEQYTYARGCLIFQLWDYRETQGPVIHDPITDIARAYDVEEKDVQDLYYGVADFDGQEHEYQKALALAEQIFGEPVSV